MNTRLKLQPLACLRCGGSLALLANGGSVWARCQNDPPACGIMIPIETARAELVGEQQGGGFPQDDPDAVTVPGGRVRPLRTAEGVKVARPVS